MATYIKTMKDINGNVILPKTNIKAVYDDSGNRLDGILNGSQLPLFTPNLSFSDTIPMHQNGSNVKIRLDDFLIQAGAPYGGVTGRGSNSNGTYVQFADGTMICYARKSTDNVTIPTGYSFRSSTHNWTFPVAFIVAPSIGIQVDAGVAFGWGALGAAGVNGNSCSFCAYSSNSAAYDAAISLTAIGRWK